MESPRQPRSHFDLPHTARFPGGIPARNANHSTLKLGSLDTELAVPFGTGALTPANSTKAQGH